MKRCRKASLPLILFFLLSLQAFAQKPDVDLSKLPKNSPEYVDALYEEASHLLYYKPDSALMYFKEALSLSRKIDYEKGEAYALNGLGNYYYITSNYPQSLSFYQQSKKLFEELGITERMPFTLNNIALIYLSQNANQKAIDTHLKAITLASKSNDSIALSLNYFNLGICYQTSKKLDSSLYYYNRAEEFLTNESRVHRLLIKNRIAENYLDMGELALARTGFEKVLQEINPKDVWERSFAQSGIAKVLLAEGRPDEAIKQAETAFKLAQENHFGWEAVRTLDILSDAYKASGDFENALKFNRLAREYNDSIFSLQKEQDLNFLQLKEKEFENQKLANKVQNRTLILWGTGLAFLILIITFYYIIRANTKIKKLNAALTSKTREINRQNTAIARQNETLESLNSMKDRIFTVIGHDLRSPLGSIQSILMLIKDGLIEKNEQEEIFEKLYQNVSILTSTLNNLLLWAKSQINGIIARPEAVDVPEVIEEQFMFWNHLKDKKHIALEVEEKAVSAVWIGKEHLRIVLRNLLGNAIKFTRPEGKVWVTFEESADEVAINIHDNGIGIKPEKLNRLFQSETEIISEPGTANETGTGIGLMLSQEFIQAYGGRITVESTLNIGSVFTVHIMKAK